MSNPVEMWKSEKHPFDVWPDIQKHAAVATPMDRIDPSDLERMKWHGFFYRKRDESGRYMNRVRVTANELSAEQARELAHIAYEYGHGIIDITTRANVQIQGLEIVHLPRVAERLEKVGLTSRQTGHDNIRNVFGHPFSGLMHDELIDTRQLCREIDAIYLGSREYSDLPRKLNICLSGSADHPAHLWTQDLSFLATRTSDGRTGFQVLLAGTQGQNPILAWHLPVFLSSEQVVPVTESLIQLFRAKGTREKRSKARLRFLVEELGIDGVLDWLESHLPFRLEPSIQPPVPTAITDDFIGWFPQKETGLWTMGLSIPLGRMTWQQMESVALLSRKWGDGQLRTTHEQGLAVINIPSGFKGAAATAAAAAGLSVHADEFERNTMACTGSQFCNIAVTETKGHMFQLIDRLRKRALKLHGIRIHMSGCPSSCAQHFTADIGLKGVRVRRLLGTREGFDVYLGGGLSGQIHMGVPFRLGVDVDQLPTLIEEVVNEFFLKHRVGQTFSSYWREKLREITASKADDNDYIDPTWVCEGCDYHHRGEDPPVFCPGCAGLRRQFARIEDESVAVTAAASGTGRSAVAQDEAPAVPQSAEDGFAFAAALAEVPASGGLSVHIGGKELALFRYEGGVRCIDSACPHEGASLAEGDMVDGVVTCPWHNWKFNVCTGCGIDPPGNGVRTYPVLVESGKVFIKLDTVPSPVRTPAVLSDNTLIAQRTPLQIMRSPAVRSGAMVLQRSGEVDLLVLDVIDEARDVKTFRLDNSSGAVRFEYPGQFVKVSLEIEGERHGRSFTISSSPSQPQVIDLTIKQNPNGTVTRHLFSAIPAGSRMRIKGATGGFYFDPDRHHEPLLLVCAGSGITPMMSISRFIRDTGLRHPVSFLYGARSEADIIFHDECQRLSEVEPWFRYFVTLSQPGHTWTGAVGRPGADCLSVWNIDVEAARCFLCGPNQFMEQMAQELQIRGVPADRIHTEAFGALRSNIATAAEAVLQ